MVLSLRIPSQSEFGRRYVASFVAAWVVLIVCFFLVERWADMEATRYHEAQFNEQQEAQVLLAKQGIEDRLQAIILDLVGVSNLAVGMGDRTVTDTAHFFESITLQRPEIVGLVAIGKDAVTFENYSEKVRSEGFLEGLLGQFRNSLPAEATSTDAFVSNYHIHKNSVYAAVAIPFLPATETRNTEWLIVFVEMSQLFDAYVGPLRVGQFGAGYVLDQAGTVLYDHEPEVIGRSVFDGLHAKFPQLLALDRQLVNQPKGTGEYQFTVARGGEVSRKLVAWNSLPFGDGRIIIAMSAPDLEIHASMDRSRRIVYVAMAILVIGFAVTTYFFVRMRQRLLQMRTEDLARSVEEKTEGLNRELQARTESEDRFRDFAESSSDWLWEMDRELRITFVSSRYEAITGVSGDFAIGKTRSEMIADVVDTETQRAHFETLQQRRAFRDFRYELRPPGGVPIMVNISGKPVFDDDGNFQGYRGVGSDITDRVRAEELRDQALREAERANLAKSEFLAAMSHEFRTPLNAILGFSEVIKLQSLGQNDIEKYTEYARDIHSSAAHLLDLVNDLLDVSAIEAGQQEVNFDFIDVAPLINESVLAIQGSAGNRGVEVITDIPEDLPTVEADPRSVRQILLNLLSNAIKASSPNDTIRVIAQHSVTGIEVTVKDSGVGIPADRLEEVTRPFVRGQRDPYKAERGWGLGLSIVSALVNLHGGVLSIESEIGNGTSVTFTLCRQVSSEASVAEDDAEDQKAISDTHDV